MKSFYLTFLIIPCIFISSCNNGNNIIDKSANNNFSLDDKAPIRDQALYQRMFEFPRYNYRTFVDLEKHFIEITPPSHVKEEIDMTAFRHSMIAMILAQVNGGLPAFIGFSPTGEIGLLARTVEGGPMRVSNFDLLIQLQPGDLLISGASNEGGAVALISSRAIFLLKVTKPNRWSVVNSVAQGGPIFVAPYGGTFSSIVYDTTSRTYTASGAMADGSPMAYSSRDRGETWVPTDPAPPFQGGLALMDVDRPDIEQLANWNANNAISSISQIAICSMRNNILKNTDTGCVVSTTPYDNVPVVGVAGTSLKSTNSQSNSIGDSLFVYADQAGHIGRSVDGGLTWSNISQENTNRLSTSLNISSLSEIIYDRGTGTFNLLGYDQNGMSVRYASENAYYWENISVPLFSKVFSTPDSYCAIENDSNYPTTVGQVWCWGSNDHNKLGLGSTPALTPTPTRALIPAPIGVAQGENEVVSYQALAGGDSHMCALRTSGNKIDCWGDGELGQLGDGMVHDRGYSSPVPTPVKISSINSVDKLVAGGSHSCILSDGKISCWGSNTEKEIDSTSTQTIFPSPTKASYNEPFSYTDVATGTDFTCAINATQVNCWGSHYSLPFQGMTLSDQPFSKFTSISAKGQTACVLSSNVHDKGTNAWCWGDNTYGEIGNGTSGNFYIAPQPVISKLGQLYFLSIYQSEKNTCGIASDSEVYCWGDNQYGQTGIPDVNMVLNPTMPIRIKNNPGQFVAIAVGTGSLSLTTLLSTNLNTDESGNLVTYALGNNGNGQLGIGSTELAESTPVPVNLPPVKESVLPDNI